MGTLWEPWKLSERVTLKIGTSGVLCKSVQTKQGMYKYVPVEFLFDLDIPCINSTAF